MQNVLITLIPVATTGTYLNASPNHRREAYMRSGLSDWLK